MNPHEIEHKAAFDVIGFAAQILSMQSEYLTRFIGAERGMHSSLHITNPTLYRDAINSEGLRQQVELSRAALAFIQAVDAVKAELKGAVT